MLTIERRANVLLITLNRAEKRNSLHPDLIGRLANALADTANDESLNVVVITGAGTTFCAGLDLNHLLSLETSGRAAYIKAVFALFRQIYELPQPVIAAINGPAVAGGFDLAVMCDLRLCASTATFAQTEILLGLTQIAYPLYKIIGFSRAKEMAMTGDAIGAEEAYRIGLVNHIHPFDELLEEALKLAGKLASRPRGALLETKRLSHDLLDLDTASAFERMKDAIIDRLSTEEHSQKADEFVRRLRGKK
ncbi:MAG TPA: enoyl-CoA hydratase/isomerase family protein [Blastocatellia bacterium]|nr:enoyl-CoA hydratase/isomerase family protein [Blastocatellia bacterium]